jgi:thiazole/oxazole-forming peptide maturase SagC family component
MLARLEDTLVYHQFVESTAAGAQPGGRWSSPQMHMLTAAVLSEAYLYTTLGMMRMAGRIVNTYMPLLEIQVQDLLRVPYCPACGFISKAQMDEMYTSSKRIVTEMMAKIELED